MDKEEWMQLAQLAQRGQNSDSAVMRAAAALLQAHVLLDALADNLLQAITAENLLGDMIDTPDGVVRYTNEAEYNRRGYDRLYMATLQDEPADVKALEEKYAVAVQDAANLGYCQLFHFKCAGDRTCDAWLMGGPITDL